MTDAVEAIEKSLTETVGASFMGATIVPGLPAVAATVHATTAASPEVTLGGEQFEFDAEFQTHIAAHCVRDLEFLRKVSHLIKPEYFENIGEAALVNLSLNLYDKYRSVPNTATMKSLIKDAKTTKVIRDDMMPLVKDALREIYGGHTDLSNGDSFAEKVATFARHQTMQQTILNSVDWLERGRGDGRGEAGKMAVNVGMNDGGEEYDYWERVKERSQQRKVKKLGIDTLKGITTGYPGRGGGRDH